MRLRATADNMRYVSDLRVINNVLSENGKNKRNYAMCRTNRRSGISRQDTANTGYAHTEDKA